MKLKEIVALLIKIEKEKNYSEYADARFELYSDGSGCVRWHTSYFDEEYLEFNTLEELKTKIEEL